MTAPAHAPVDPAPPPPARLTRTLAPVWTLWLVGALALVNRWWAYLDPTQLLASRELDDATMYAVAVNLVHGNLPYRDVLYLHPPAMPVAMAPLAWLGEVVGDSHALAVGRVGAVLLGVLSTVLIGRLLRRRGAVAVLCGAGLYAAWTPVVRTERHALLEPVLVVLGLLALGVLRRGGLWERRNPAVTGRARTWPGRGRGLMTVRPGTAVLTGVLLGLSLTFKVWAVVPIAVVALVLWWVGGWRPVGWYALGGVVTVGVVCGPFLALAGVGRVWHDVVTVQSARPVYPNPMIYRLRRITPAGGGENPVADALLWVAFAVTVAVLVVALVRAVRRRAATETAVWALLALTCSALLVVAPVYFYHYGAWVAPYFSLLLGAGAAAAWAAWRDRAVALSAGADDAARRVRTGRRVAGGVGGVVLAALCVASWIPTKPPQGSNAPLVAWASTRECVWGLASGVVRADAATPNVEHGCQVPADVYGTAIIAATDAGAKDLKTVMWDHPWWQAEVLRQLEHADGALLPPPDDGPYLSGEDLARFEQGWEKVGRNAQFEIWQRRAAP